MALLRVLATNYLSNRLKRCWRVVSRIGALRRGWRAFTASTRNMRVFFLFKKTDI